MHDMHAAARHGRRGPAGARLTSVRRAPAEKRARRIQAREARAAAEAAAQERTTAMVAEAVAAERAAAADAEAARREEKKEAMRKALELGVKRVRRAPGASEP
jgi:hypothetical protein